MEKVYRLLPWLDIAQALDYLEYLTETPFSDGLLLQLCDAGECAVYLDCMGLDGEAPFDAGEDQPGYEPVVGRGHCKVEYPLLQSRSGFATHVIGPAWLAFDGIVKDDCEWIIRRSKAGLSLIFKSADIEALAAKMNGEPEQSSTAEVESLRQQLEQERGAREAAEQQVLQAQADAKAASEKCFDAVVAATDMMETTIARLSAELERERTARQAAEQRAEQAETDAKPSHLLAVAALLELLLDGSRPRYTQGSAADAIEARHPDWRGSSSSQLTKLFAEAKATAKEADKVAQAKAEARQAAASRAEARKTAKT